MLRFTVLASGSEGNALVVECGQTRLLIDCGLKSVKELERRLLSRGLEAASISAIVITHEHADHVGCAATFARRYDIPVYGTYGTLNGWSESSKVAKLCPFDSHEIFCINDIEITPFPVPHDAREPSQFVFSEGSVWLGLLTDVGRLTPHIARNLSGCDALILEANHDLQLLQNGRYPPHLKRRISGEYGHLSNDQAARFLQELDLSRLQHIVAAHLSQENNRPKLAQAAFAEVLGCELEWVGVADQYLGLDWRSIA